MSISVTTTSCSFHTNRSHFKVTLLDFDSSTRSWLIILFWFDSKNVSGNLIKPSRETNAPINVFLWFVKLFFASKVGLISFVYKVPTTTMITVDLSSQAGNCELRFDHPNGQLWWRSSATRQRDAIMALIAPSSVCHCVGIIGTTTTMRSGRCAKKRRKKL